MSAEPNGSSVVKVVVLCAGEGLGGACRAVRSSSGSKLGEVTRVGDGSDPLGVGVRASVAGLNPTSHDTSWTLGPLAMRLQMAAGGMAAGPRWCSGSQRWG